MKPVFFLHNMKLDASL